MSSVPRVSHPGQKSFISLSKRNNIRSGEDSLTCDCVTESCFLIVLQDKFICDWWFNVDCEASPGYYDSVASAFGGGETRGDSGQCPAPASGQCQDSVDTCWSPGHTDLDCPGSGLCW